MLDLDLAEGGNLAIQLQPNSYIPLWSQLQQLHHKEAMFQHYNKLSQNEIYTTGSARHGPCQIGLIQNSLSDRSASSGLSIGRYGCMDLDISCCWNLG
ncbi:unnamed protein product [Ambrosiozyma monospora]|uniref:Unnamed protein product n=1 Tax=Ambrosiozyma monospora TaxID=43982 RepID=A0ACB5UB07_AMBMO|nr:unnamed protein product [Ambrosiozyma monospora]